MVNTTVKASGACRAGCSGGGLRDICTRRRRPRLHSLSKAQRFAASRGHDHDHNAAWNSTVTTPRLPETPCGTAVVVGAGAAGLATALELAKFGMQVHVRCLHTPLGF